MKDSTCFAVYHDELSAHCRRTDFSSNTASYLSCQAYREIVSMGRDVFPHIREALETDTETPVFVWAAALREIAGSEFLIPKAIRGQQEEIRRYAIEWLERLENPET